MLKSNKLLDLPRLATFMNRVRATRKLRQMMAAQPKATGAIGLAGPGRGKVGSKAGPTFNDAPTLADLGIDKNLADRRPLSRFTALSTHRRLREVARRRPASQLDALAGRESKTQRIRNLLQL